MNIPLINRTKNPYYIAAANYTRMSAGIKVLHRLCHYLNMKGERAYLIIYPAQKFNPVSPELYTPLLTQEIIDEDFKKGLCPIMIYPETISGNPLQAPFVVRYLLNFPGLLGGDENIYDDFVVSYSQTIAENIKRSDFTFFIPVSDPDIFRPLEGVLRKGSCFYASKYKNEHGQKTFPITDDSFEITRGQPDSLSQKEVAKRLASSELFYCYENSSLIIEAILSGCPVVLLNNPFFTRLIGIHEHGTDGIAFDTKPESIEQARKTVHRARERYLALIDTLPATLDRFIEETQKRAKGTDYKKSINLKAAPPPVLLRICKKLVGLQMTFCNAWEARGLLYAFKRAFHMMRIGTFKKS